MRGYRGCELSCAATAPTRQRQSRCQRSRTWSSMRRRRRCPSKRYFPRIQTPAPCSLPSFSVYIFTFMPTVSIVYRRLRKDGILGHALFGTRKYGFELEICLMFSLSPLATPIFCLRLLWAAGIKWSWSDSKNYFCGKFEFCMLQVYVMLIKWALLISFVNSMPTMSWILVWGITEMSFEPAFGTKLSVCVLESRRGGGTSSLSFCFFISVFSFLTAHPLDFCL